MKDDSAIVLVFFPIAFHIAPVHLDALMIAPKKRRIKPALIGRIYVDWTP